MTKALWCIYDGKTSGYVRVYAKKADGTQLVTNTTSVGVADSYFTVSNNNGTGSDVTVTVTSDDGGYIRFSGVWTQGGDSQTLFADANTKATLTYTPAL